MNYILIRKMENNERVITIIKIISPGRIITKRITQIGQIRDTLQDIECQIGEEFTLKREEHSSVN